LRDKDFLRRAEAQLEELVWTAEVVSLEGPGSSRTVVLDFSSDGGIRFDRLTVGDHRDGPNQTAVRLVLSTGSSIVRITDMPPVPMSGPDGGAVVVQSTTATMTVRCAIEDGVQRVLVEVA
ncbi:MAG: hypothetical protein MUE55_07125, partial [Thermoplasmata archaeon]|nr:hypothetical protein [Thermoplasmata archaeon]